jgi:hypothetical protein
LAAIIGKFHSCQVIGLYSMSSSQFIYFPAILIGILI